MEVEAMEGEAMEAMEAEAMEGMNSFIDSLIH
jgi:hypothetical protein